MYQPTARIYGSSYTTLMRRQPSQATSHDYSTLGMSTHSSSQGFDTGSSQHRIPPRIDPTSIYEPVDPILFSSFAGQEGFRCTSQSSEPLYRGTPARISSSWIWVEFNRDTIAYLSSASAAAARLL
jgi:hypothetical protein